MDRDLSLLKSNKYLFTKFYIFYDERSYIYFSYFSIFPIFYAILKDIFKKLILCLLLVYRNDLFLYTETGNYILIKLT